MNSDTATDESIRDVREEDHTKSPAKPDTTTRRVGRPPADAAGRKARVEAAVSALQSEGQPFGVGEVAARSGVSRATIYRLSDLRTLIPPPQNPTTAGEPDVVGNTAAGGFVNELETLRLRKRRLRSGEVQQRERIEHLRDQLQNERQRIVRLRLRTDQAVAYAQRTRETLARQQQRVQELSVRLRAVTRRQEEAEMRARSAEQVADQQARLREEAEDRAADRSSVSGESLEQARKAGYEAGYQAGNRVATRAARREGGTGLSAAVADLSTAELVAARRRLARVLHPDLFADDPHANLLATELLKQINALAAAPASAASSRRR